MKMPPIGELLAVIAIVVNVGLMFAAWAGANRRAVAHSRKQAPPLHAEDHPSRASFWMFGIAATATAISAAAQAQSWDLTFPNIAQLAFFGATVAGMAGHSLLLLLTGGRPERDAPGWVKGAAWTVAALGGAAATGWVTA
ncbi:hypothetical protein HUT18_09855 [Streptomyces sp. NA04227]|uniref:hypothetical protein n=1 Tax=Streptomyces sp. NA04227 TaxID=2742136 RepID=UPI00159151FB|nr:hypothetical protein [Streptomyces sp. NA04227]QKW06662.1 hypothetical protein HUT18_09855 [Streptomyces sp. NA04227]